MALIDRMHDYKLRAHDNLDPPVMKTPTILGEAGAGNFSYRATLQTIVGETTPTDAVAVSNAPTVLDSGNCVKLEIESAPAGTIGVNYYKLVDDQYRLLGTVSSAPWRLYDLGQTPSASVIVPIDNTSGRPQWRALLFNAGKYLQRQELVDLQWILLRGIKDIGDTIYKNGDIIRGCAEQLSGNNQVKFTDGAIYLDGQRVQIPESETLTLIGVGKEVVGVLVEPVIIPSSQDLVIRNQDEGKALEYAQSGADRLAYDITWVIDNPAAIKIKEFLDGLPVKKTYGTQRSQWEIDDARHIYDINGDFVVDPFPYSVKDHPTDPASLIFKVDGGGKAYVQGFEAGTISPQSVTIPKARDTKAENNSALEAFSITGGSAIGNVLEPFNVNSLYLSIKVGEGQFHLVALSGASQTAAQVATQINNSVNAYPTSGTLVNCVAANGKLQISAIDGKSLTLETVANSAYAVMGLQAGTYNPAGQRLYKVNNSFIKNVTDFNYITEVVEQVIHNGSTHIDTLANTNVYDILGAADNAADCHDGHWKYQENIDFEKNGNSMDFMALNGTDPPSDMAYFVKYRYVKNAVKGIKKRIRVTDALIVKTSESGSDTLVYTNGTAIEAVSGASVTGLSGNVKDLIRILRVNNSPGQSQSEYDSYSAVKGATALGFEDSKISWASAGAQGVTPGGQPVTGSNFYVTFEAWMEVLQGDYISADSFLNDYEQIELTPDGVTSLRDYIDFRRNTSSLPVPNDAPRFDYEYYLSRIDKVAIQADAYCIRIPGSPALRPVPPHDQTGPLSIFSLYIPPYTYSPDDVVVQSLEIQRKTQHSLNEMAAEIERSKYYNALYLAERTVLDDSAATGAKGIFVDPVAGQKNLDLAFSKNGIETTVAVDPTEGCYRLPVTEDGRQITVDEANSTGIATVGKVLVFDYSTKPYFEQLKATRVLNVNPHATYAWIGAMEINPQSDFWTDVNQIPALDVNYDEQMQALVLIDAANAERARQITWGAWRLTWDNSGGWAESTLWEEGGGTSHWQDSSNATMIGETYVGSANAARERAGTYKSIVPERKLVDVGDRVVDMTAVPYMRTKDSDGNDFTIAIDASGLLPLTDIACTIDGVVVNLTPTGSTIAGTLQYSNKTTIRTSAAGRATGTFVVPAGIRVGKKAIKVFSAADPAETYAISLFESQGFLETHQKLVQGIISTTERDEVTNQTQFHYGDPIAYTFPVTEGTQWISYVKLKFASKDTSLPVTVEVRGTLNGYPTRKVYQSVTLDPSQVSVSADASAWTTFTFPNLVGYTAREYCVVVIANCQTYTLWVSKMGEVDVVTGNIVRDNPAGGVLFESPNDSFWDGYADMDLCCEIGTANFENNAQIVFNEITGIEANMLIAAITQFLPQGCNLHWAYALNGTDDWIAFLPGIDTELGQIATSVKPRCDIFSTGGTFQIEKSGAGIILLLNKPLARAVWSEQNLESPADKITFVCNLAVDGVNGIGNRSFSPFYTTDGGEHWTQLFVPSGYTPIAIGDGTYKEYRFESPDQKTITDVTNASPMVVSSNNHEFKENAVVEIADITGCTAANSTWRLKTVTAGTFALVDPVTGVNSQGNGAYTGGGLVKLAEFSKIRYMGLFETDSRTVTPKLKKPRGYVGMAA
jgi:hypothetical protein